MSKTFVIAGNLQEANSWIRGNIEKRMVSGETTLSMSEYVYVRDPISIRGYRNPHGVFIGTWKERKDLEDIFQHLLLAIDITSNSHRIVNQMWGEWKERNPKPTPKKFSGLEITQVIIDELADDLAKNMNEEVMKRIGMKINGGMI